MYKNNYYIYIFLVFGALLGKQNGRNLELCNSFELQHSETDDGCIIDMDYFQNKEEQCILINNFHHSITGLVREMNLRPFDAVFISLTRNMLTF